MIVRIAVAVAAIAGCFVVAPVADATPNPSTPCIDQTPNPGDPFQPLHVCASFDKTAYKSSDRITVTVTITNEGTATATGLWMDAVSYNSIPLNAWTGLDGVNSVTAGASLAAGATATITAWGWSADPASGYVEFVGLPLQNVNGAEGPASADLDINAPVTVVTGNYGGLVYTTTDANDVPSPTAGLPGVQATMTHLTDGTTYESTTDSTGHFLFTALPGGPYTIAFAAPDNWLVRPHSTYGGEIVVTDTGVEYDPNYHAVRPESQILQATMTFDQPSYPVGATATLTVTLTNLTTRTMVGVKDECNLAGNGDDLMGTGPGWSPLDDPAGATIPPGTTVLHVSETVPHVMVYPGYPPTFYAGCAFGNDVDFQGEPYVTTTTLVTGE